VYVCVCVCVCVCARARERERERERDRERDRERVDTISNPSFCQALLMWVCITLQVLYMSIISQNNKTLPSL
jgi:hypothetical protein